MCCENKQPKQLTRDLVTATHVRIHQEGANGSETERECLKQWGVKKTDRVVATNLKSKPRRLGVDDAKDNTGF